jgi:hypothetical protein
MYYNYLSVFCFPGAILTSREKVCVEVPYRWRESLAMFEKPFVFRPKMMRCGTPPAYCVDRLGPLYM